MTHRLCVQRIIVRFNRAGIASKGAGATQVYSTQSVSSELPLSHPARMSLVGAGDMSAVRVTVAVACVLTLWRNGTFMGSNTVCFQAIPGDFCGEGGEGNGAELAVVGLDSATDDVGGSETATSRSTICSESSVRSTSADEADEERRPGLKMERMLGRRLSCVRRERRSAKLAPWAKAELESSPLRKIHRDRRFLEHRHHGRRETLRQGPLAHRPRTDP